MDDEQTRLVLGVVTYLSGAAYCGVALWWYTKGRASAPDKEPDKDA